MAWSGDNAVRSAVPGEVRQFGPKRMLLPQALHLMRQIGRIAAREHQTGRADHFGGAYAMPLLTMTGRPAARASQQT